MPNAFRQARTRRCSMAVMLLTLSAAHLFAQSPDRFAGRPLEDALRLLQSRGVRIVFSSELVTPEMRVAVEPPAKTPLEQLRLMLDPHGLAAEQGPGDVILVVRRTRGTRDAKRSAPGPSRAAAPAREALTPFDPNYRERLTVTANGGGPAEMNGSTARHLGRRDLQALAGRIADDPVRLVQLLPGVAAGDDFSSEYSVRGSAYRHAAMFVDGVAAPWLQHAAMGRGDAGSLTMLSGDLVQGASLLVGAYPRKDGGQIGPQLNITLREGSRTARRLRASVSGTTAMITTEGPLGDTGRGSWIAAVRRSHAEWPAGRDDHGATVFGFSDLHSKLVYDVRPAQQVTLSIVAGWSNIDSDLAAEAALAAGLNRASLVSLAWRSLVAPRTVVTQRVSVVARDFLNRDRSARLVNRGADTAAAYRLDATRAMFGGIIETGGQFRHVSGSRRGPIADVVAAGSATDVNDHDTAASWLERSGHVSFTTSLGPTVTAVAGLRAADSTLVDRAVIDRWLRADWAAGPGWLLHGSYGTVHQFASLDHVRGWTGTFDLRPERATHVDVGLTRRLSGALHLAATLFARRERDTLREPLMPMHPTGDLTNEDPSRRRFENALTGTGRGIELALVTRTAGRLSGWIGYAYGVARYADDERGEAFDADHDQRHAINASGTAALPHSVSLGLTFRGGTNFPIPGYLVARDGRFFAGDRRNQARLPAYARLDVRVERTIQHGGRQFVLFTEALNVLNRTNVGLADGRTLRDTGEVAGVTERLFPRLITAGVRVEF